MKSATNTPNNALPEFPPNDLTAGVDWARDDHAVSVVNDRGREIYRCSVPHTDAGLRELRIVGFRWACDKQLRDAVTDFAADTRHANPWAADLYDQARARGHDHAHAVRILARSWLHVIWHCW